MRLPNSPSDRMALVLIIYRMALVLIIFFVILIALCIGTDKVPETQIGIIYEYVFENGQKICRDHGGLRYVVSIKSFTEETEEREMGFKEYPCSDLYKFRCQDRSLHDWNSGVDYCFIDQGQLKETLEGK